jgi:hypothetical protein
MFKKIFGVDQKKKESLMKEKPIDSGRIQYMGGHKAYPKPEWSDIYFYEDRFEIEVNRISVQYSKIIDIGNSNDRSDTGILIPPVALAYLWKKEHSYTLIVYDDGINTQKIVIDFENDANDAQDLIYKKMLDCRKIAEHKKLARDLNSHSAIRLKLDSEQ